MTINGSGSSPELATTALTFERISAPSPWVRIDYEDAPDGIDVDLDIGQARNDGFGSVDTHSRQWYGKWAVSNHADTIRGSDNKESFLGRGGNDIIDGRGGFDRLRFSPSNVGELKVDLTAGTATGSWDGRPFHLFHLEYRAGARRER